MSNCAVVKGHHGVQWFRSWRDPTSIFLVVPRSNIKYITQHTVLLLSLIMAVLVEMALRCPKQDRVEVGKCFMFLCIHFKVLKLIGNLKELIFVWKSEILPMLIYEFSHNVKLSEDIYRKSSKKIHEACYCTLKRGKIFEI